MEFAQSFFVKEAESEADLAPADAAIGYYETHVSENLDRFWEGTFKVNPMFKNRAYVSVPQLNCDILIDSYKHMNRAFDGDKVLVDLLSVQAWSEINE